MVLWSAGFSSAGVLHILRLAIDAGTRIRVWCDLDLGGVRIARLIRARTNGLAEPVLMSADLAASAAVTRPLSPDQAALIRKDLETRPEEILSDTLRAILARSAWIEQEGLLNLVPSLLGPRPAR